MEIYKGQKVIVRRQKRNIGREMRQGSYMSPVLYNLYVEKLVDKSPGNSERNLGWR